VPSGISRWRGSVERSPSGPAQTSCGWVQAGIEGIPEVITAGPTKENARALVLDALREHLASIRGNGEADREQADLVIAGAD
jgi:hypothetical protein